MSRDRVAQLWNAVLLVVASVGLAWSLIQVFTSPLDPDVAAPMRVANFFSFFTILSNILVAVVAATLAIDPRRDGRWWRVLHLDALLCIAVTGIVVQVVLRNLQQLDGTRAVTDALVHIVVPLMMVIGWLLFGPRPRIDRSTILWGLALPLVWLAYTLVRGEVVDWYPYPFLDVSEIGYGRALINVAVVAVLFLLLGAAASRLERWLGARSRLGDLVS